MPGMRVVVDPAVCRGHGRCAAAAAEIFELDEEGYCETREVLVPPELERVARDGAASCPERAISVENAERGSK